MSKLKDAAQELQIIETYINAYSGYDECKFSLTSDGNIVINTGVDIISIGVGDKTIYEIVNYILEILRGDE